VAVSGGSGRKTLARPRRRHAALSFNLSYTDGLVACAITADRRWGIDVESVDRRVSDGVAARFFRAARTAGLRRACARAIEAERFFELSDVEGSVMAIKAVGAGLSHPLNTVVFSVGGEGAIAFGPAPGVDAACWRVRVLFAPTHANRWLIAVGTRLARPRRSPTL
jgi:hypothetical protein